MLFRSDIGSRPDDVIILGRCDEMVRRLCRLLGWEQELDVLWDSTKNSLDPEDQRAEATPTDLEAEVQKLTDEVEQSLKLASKLKEAVATDETHETTTPTKPQAASVAETATTTTNVAEQASGDATETEADEGGRKSGTSTESNVAGAETAQGEVRKAEVEVEKSEVEEVQEAEAAVKKAQVPEMSPKVAPGKL